MATKVAGRRLIQALTAAAATVFISAGIVTAVKLIGPVSPGLTGSESVSVAPTGVKTELRESSMASPPDIGRVFSEVRSPVDETDPGIRTVIATGDILPARTVNTQTLKYGDFTWAYREIAGFTASADITLVNLETPLVSGCPATDSGMIFCGVPDHIYGLKFAGIDVVNIANNHIGNFGADGISQTKQLLAASDFSVSGVTGEPVVLDIDGVRFGFAGFNDIGEVPDGINPASPETVTAVISRTRGKSDVVIASFHWGQEYTRMPSQRQISLARQAVDAGATLVIGNHPHWIQPVEKYAGGFIAYSHGNTVFDQMWSEETRLGVLGKYTFHGSRLIDVEYFPVRIESFGQPQFLKGSQKNHVLEMMASASAVLLKP